jgi:hypothetical protein
VKVYIEVSEDVVDASKDLFDTTHQILDKQFDNVWAKPGMRVFEVLVQKLSDEQFASHVRIVSGEGKDMTPDEVAEILDENNVIWQ